MEDLHQSYRTAEDIARRRARNFYYSFMVLPREKRRAICAVYAFMRHCDDLADGDGPAAEKRERLSRWRSRLDSALQGDTGGFPFLPAFRDTVQRFSIPPEYFHWMIDGVEMDLGVSRYQTFDELYRYCFNVASSVGLTCLQIFGYSDEGARKHAEHCGVAFQLTNILRDIREDALMGRVYLPAEDLDRFHYRPDELLDGVADSRFRRLMAFEAGRAHKYYTCGRNLIPLIDRPGRPALWAMIEIYSQILRKIVRRRFNVFGPTIRLSGALKASIALRALTMRFLPGAWTAR